MNDFISDLDLFQNEARSFDIGAKDPRDARTVHMLGLAGEAGEIIEKYKKHLRDGTELDIEDLQKELGDVLWYVANVCCDYNLDMSKAAWGVIYKLIDRKARGKLGGSGDNR